MKYALTKTSMKSLLRTLIVNKLIYYTINNTKEYCTILSKMHLFINSKNYLLPKLNKQKNMTLNVIYKN